MEEFNERAQSTGLSAARHWYWRATLRNMIALAADELTREVRPRTLFLISGIWLSISLLWTWLSHGWLMGFTHQAWGVVTIVIFLLYFLLLTGWLVPLSWALIRLVSPSLMRGRRVR